VTTAAQPNITSVGTLSSLSVTGTVTGGNLATAGTASAGGNITGANISTGGTVSATGNITGGNVTTAGLTNTGTLQTSGNAIIGGNLQVNGNTISINVTNLNVQDPIIGLGRGPNNAPLTVNDGKDRGTEMWYYNTAERAAFVGFDNSTGKIIAAANVSITDEIVTVNNFGSFVTGAVEAATVSATGTVTGGNLATAGTASAGGNITGANLITGGVVTATGTITGGNIATAGTASATGNITGGNVSTAGRVTATGNLVTGANVIATGYITATGNITGGNITTTGIGNIATLEITTLANIKATTAASNTTSGALRVAGGVGVVGNIYAGDIYSTGNLVLTVESTVDGGTY
jgi:hypothetical protein